MKGVTDMKEEKELFQKIGKENPFKVPEGYFENLTQQVMERLPEKEPQPTQEISMWERVKPWVYMAAMFVGLMFTVQVFVGKQEQQAGPAGVCESGIRLVGRVSGTDHQPDHAGRLRALSISE